MRCLESMILVASILNGAQLTVRRFPAIVDTDGPPIVTSMLLRLPMKTYGDGGKPLDALLNDAHLDEREHAMVAYLNSIRTSNATMFRALEYVPRPNTKGTLVPTTQTSPFDQIVAGWKRIFDNFRNVRLEYQIPMETGDLFIWKAQTANGWLRQGFLVLLAEGKPRVDFAGPNHLIEASITGSFNRPTIDSLERTAVQPSERREFALDLDGRGSALEFNGQYVSAEACGVAAPIPPAGRALCAAAAKLREGDRDGYLALLWNPSRERMEELFKRYGFEGWCKVQYPFEYEHIRFILDADPVFIVFLTTTGGNTWPDGALYHRYVFRGPSGLAVGNVHLQNLFDSALEKDSANLLRLLKRGNSAASGAQPGSHPKPGK